MRGKSLTYRAPKRELTSGGIAESQAELQWCKHIQRELAVGRNDEQTTSEFLANLQHEFWVPRDSVWLGPAARQHERHLNLPWRKA